MADPSVLPGLIWGLPFAAMARLASRRPDVAAATPLPDLPVSVILPARNEAANIENVLASLLATEHRAMQLIVVDDRSTDDTAERVDRLAGSDPRVTLVHGAELPEGWLGKPWACAQGAALATADHLLFTDADTTHHPALLGLALGAMREGEADLLTLTSRQRCETVWERLVMPQIWVLLGARYPPHRVNRATRLDQLVANGQFILVRREAYEGIGGHGAVRGEVVEDLALSHRFFEAGRRVRMWFGESRLSTRMYRSLGQMVEGWSKNLYVGARQSVGRHPVVQALAPWGVLLAFAFWLVPPALLLLGIWGPAMWLAVGVSLAFWALVSFGMAIPPWYALGYPVGALMAIGIMLRSMLRGTRRIEWRGRTYRVAR